MTSPRRHPNLRSQSLSKHSGLRPCLPSALATVLGVVALGIGATPAGAFTVNPCGENIAVSYVGATVTCTFQAAGEDGFQVPEGVTQLSIEAVGGEGAPSRLGGSAGGFGATVSSDLEVTEGSEILVRVAGNGVRGAGGLGGGGEAGGTGDPGEGGGGGGASSILSPEGEELLTAGGGGGGGGYSAAPGGEAGEDGLMDLGNIYSGDGGEGGTVSGGGEGGAGGIYLPLIGGGSLSSASRRIRPDGQGPEYGLPGFPGSQGQGGVGGDALDASGNGSGGGGGGGHFGGGGGGGGAPGGEGGGGGGGSSYSDGTSTAIGADTTGVPLVSISWTAAPPTVTVTNPTSGETYDVGQDVTEEFTCADGTGGPGISSCLDQEGGSPESSLNTSTPGEHTLTVTAVSDDGQEATAEVGYTVEEAPTLPSGPTLAAPPTATVTTPTSGATYMVGQDVAEEFSCAEGLEGPGLASCLDQSGEQSGAYLETTVPGPHTLTVTAISGDGQEATTEVGYTVAEPPVETIIYPTQGATYSVGQAVQEIFGCERGAYGGYLNSCLNQEGRAAGGDIDTSTPGRHTLTVIADAEGGQVGEASVEYTVVAAPTATVTSPEAGKTYAVGQDVAEEFSCSEGAEGPGLMYCWDQDHTFSPTELDTSTPGTHTLTVTAISWDGQDGTAEAQYTVAAAPTATISSPESGATYEVGQTVPEEFSCVEGEDGTGLSSCTDQEGHPSGSDLETATPGLHTLTVTATSQDGQTGTAEAQYTVEPAVAPTPAAPTVTSTVPSEGGSVYEQGQVVADDFTCAEGSGGPGLASCVDQEGHPSGADLETQALGAHTMTFTAKSLDGQSEEVTVTYHVIARPTVIITSPKEGAVFAVGQKVAEEFHCTAPNLTVARDAGPDEPAPLTCLDQDGNPTGTELGTATPGTYTLTVTEGLRPGLAAPTHDEFARATASVTYTVAGAPTATTSAPTSGATYTEGQAVAEGFSCAEGASGPGIASCTDQEGRDSGADLDTSSLGTHTLVVTATSSDGQAGTASVEYTVVAPAAAPQATPQAQAPVASPPAPKPIAPVLSDLQVLHSCLRKVSLSTPHPGSKGLAVSFDLSEAASVSYVVERREDSAARGQCPSSRPSRPHDGGQPGTYKEVGAGQQPGAASGGNTTDIGSATAAGAHAQQTGHSTSGEHHVSLAGLSRHLAPGTYIISVVATNAAGESSARALAYFWVIK